MEGTAKLAKLISLEPSPVFGSLAPKMSNELSPQLSLKKTQKLLAEGGEEYYSGDQREFSSCK
jgi:hypothetical protein